jgi:hypothetical protein
VILIDSATGTTDNYVLKMDGADHITFRKLTIQAKGSFFSRVVELTNGANFNRFENNVISGVSTFFTTTNIATIFSTRSTDEFNVFKNNVINNGSYGIYFEGLSSCGNASENGTVIQNNQITDAYRGSIFLQFQNATQVTLNTIATKASHNSYAGVEMSFCNGNIEVAKNEISGGRNYGVYLNNSNATSGNPGLIANNMIQVGGNSVGYGIYSNVSNFQRFYHNSVLVSSTDTDDGRAFYTNGGGNLSAFNNIFSNIGGGYSIYINTTSAIDSSNYNDLFTTGCNLGFWDSVATDLTEWQTNSGGDANSISIEPNFFTSDDLHSGATDLNGQGFDLSATITEDIDGDVRPATPFIGADEYLPNPGALSGTYSIPGDYASFNAAVTDLTDKGISGSITFNVADGTYNEQISIPAINGVNASDSIVFQSSSGDSSLVTLIYTAASSTDNFTVKLDGADHFTFRNMKIEAAGSTFARCIELTNGANFNRFENNILKGFPTTNTAINQAVIYSGSTKDEYNTINNNIIEDGAYGIYLTGLSSDCEKSLEHGTRIYENEIYNANRGSVFLQNQYAPEIESNETTTTSFSSAYVCVEINSCSDAIRILKNKVSGGVNFGIYFNKSNSSAGSEGLIANNMIQVGGNSTAYGLNFTNSSGQLVYHNSVNLNGSSASNGRAAFITGGSDLTFFNNILANSGG